MLPLNWLLMITNDLSWVNNPISVGIVDPAVAFPSVKVLSSTVARHSFKDESERKLQAICSGVEEGIGEGAGAAIPGFDVGQGSNGETPDRQQLHSMSPQSM